MKKEWKHYYGNYYVSNEGEIKNFKTNHILKLKINNGGYYSTNIRVDGKIKTIRPHRLVAELFIPNEDNKPYVNHIDGNKLNNKVTNLEWCTPKENTKHAFKNNLCNQHTTGIPCVKMDFYGNILETFPSLLSAAKSVNGYYNGIYKTCIGEYSQYKGYIWKYLKDINSLL